MKAYRAVLTSLFLGRMREPVGLFFSFLFAPLMVLILGTIFGNDPSADFAGQGYLDATLPAFASLVLAITGVLLLPVNQLTFRETGALRRLSLTPLRPTTFVAADLSVNFIVGFVGIVAALAVGTVLFGVELPQHLGLVLAAAAFGLVAFLALGYLLAALYPSTAAATGIGNVLMILLMMSSGAFVPLSVLSEGIRNAFEFSPARQFVMLIEGLWAGDAWSTLLVPTAVLTAMTIVCGTVGHVLSRRRAHL